MWPRLIEPLRELLSGTVRPSVIENVEGSAFIDPVVLCGTMFDGLRVIRQRVLRFKVELRAPEESPSTPCPHNDKRKLHYGRPYRARRSCR